MTEPEFRITVDPAPNGVGFHATVFEDDIAHSDTFGPCESKEDAMDLALDFIKGRLETILLQTLGLN